MLLRHSSKNYKIKKQTEVFFLSNLFLQLSAVLFPHGGGMSFFRCLLRIRSARGLRREEDEVHRLTSTMSALFSTYASYNDINVLLLLLKAFIIHQVKTKEIITVTVVWISDLL